MKKTYVKPQIYFEDFQLSANIAAGCGKPLNHTMETCQPISGMILFVDGNSSCQYKTDKNGVCYQSFSTEGEVFTS